MNPITNIVLGDPVRGCAFGEAVAPLNAAISEIEQVVKLDYSRRFGGLWSIKLTPKSEAPNHKIMEVFARLIL